ncbi:hypothetical protein [Stenotrophomonas sp. HMWF003]|uniref:hypothetical protein n=1 Tax=Stenotrophomonas sp. HMWF003 TaxID=2056840 RepID=UPI000D4BF4D3|nr:hypothetical protein [Stenotrophomonas sp. HMWF003]PTT59667.1 hypothetical protein DBR34_14510 [Stenotrophomonas sp. HMWF003]
MRWILLVMGLFCMLAGVAQMAFGVYAFDSSDHGGSWINVRGSLARYFVDHPQRDLVDYQRYVALKVMKALETSVEVHLLSGLVFLAMGAVLLVMFWWWERRITLRGGVAYRAGLE